MDVSANQAISFLIHSYAIFPAICHVEPERAYFGEVRVLHAGMMAPLSFPDALLDLVVCIGDEIVFIFF